MPKDAKIVINTGPLLALVAACGDLTLLQKMYREVIVPPQVCEEIMKGGSTNFAVAQFKEAFWLKKWTDELAIEPFLNNTLDLGEASVIQLAIQENIKTVCIDETLGRRVARLHGLQLTGSIGILLRAKNEEHIASVLDAVNNMRSHGIWLSERVVSFALRKSGERAPE